MSTPPGSARRIVLVEDIEDNRRTLESLLTLDGHQVTTAHDGETGCELIRRLRPHVALVDIGLPGINGYEVARRVRSDQACARHRASFWDSRQRARAALRPVRVTTRSVSQMIVRDRLVNKSNEKR